MNTLCKALIVWLMLVAIPFQGFAAASMLTCAPVQAAPVMTAGHCVAMATASHHDGDPSAAGHHCKCATCASCCFGAAMAPPVLLVRVPGGTPALTVFHFENSRVARVDLALPERPPKPS